jgi:uncharacterized membrane protein YkvA (DUF1232 family)
MATRSRWIAFTTLVRAVRGTMRPGEPGVGDRLRALPRLVSATLSGRYQGVTPRRLGLMALALVYIVSPIDLLPDMLPLLGLADDAMVVAWLAGTVLSETGDFLAWERGPTGRTRRSWFRRRDGQAGPDVVRGQVVR